jgi:hypothetical protein
MCVRSRRPLRLHVHRKIRPRIDGEVSGTPTPVLPGLLLPYKYGCRPVLNLGCVVFLDQSCSLRHHTLPFASIALLRGIVLANDRY